MKHGVGRRSRSWRRIASVPLSGLLVVGLLAACGAEGGESGSATYKIAGLIDYSGPFANRGEPVEQMHRLLIDWFNDERGPEVGVTLDYESFDDGYDQAKAVQAYQRLRPDKSILGIANFSLPSLIALQDRLSGDGIPLVHGGPAASVMPRDGWMFSPLGYYPDYYLAAIKWRLRDWSESRPLNVSLVTFDGASGQEWVNGLEDRIGGVNARLQSVFLQPTANEVSAPVRQVLDTEPDMVIAATTDSLQPLVLRELKNRGFDMTKVLNSQHESLGLLEKLEVEPDVLEGEQEITTQNYIDTSTEAYQIFDARQDEFTTRWSADTLLHFSSMLVLLDAVDRAAKEHGAEGLTGRDVFEQLDGGTFDGYGLVPDIKFGPDRTRGPEGAFLLRYSDGKITRVGDEVLEL